MPDFEFAKVPPDEVARVVQQMRSVMERAEGVGLSANQVGLSWRLFVARDERKFYAVFNPVIVKTAKAKVAREEGCLSIPRALVTVPRAERVTLEGSDRRGRKVRLAAKGFLARVFQHEIDHLNGKLITDYR
ncbi:MAG: peptide deformylase [Candidatus Colwellbacteria bacterium]|nr:peptide deformylase [Candidatus Colwellbacteria bacterium]